MPALTHAKGSTQWHRLTVVLARPNGGDSKRRPWLSQRERSANRTRHGGGLLEDESLRVWQAARHAHEAAARQVLAELDEGAAIEASSHQSRPPRPANPAGRGTLEMVRHHRPAAVGGPGGPSPCSVWTATPPFWTFSNSTSEGLSTGPRWQSQGEGRISAALLPWRLFARRLGSPQHSMSIRHKKAPPSGGSGA
jgi:hypothetical protein